MKKLTRFLLALVLCAGAVTGAALAAGGFVEPPVTVQLNGETMVFTDAKPQLKDERTFLPFYAVFNALGADVKWTEAEPDKVVAIRDGKTLTMYIGSHTVALEEEGRTTYLNMDVAPYIDPTTDRTYVPVFFAADALDCSVGWDPDTFTAIIVDTDALVEKAVAGKSYTWLEKLDAYSKKFTKGTWQTDMTMSGSMTVLGAEMPLKLTATNTTTDQSKVEMEMAMTIDMRQLAQLSQQVGGEELPQEEQAILSALAADNGFGFAVRGDLEAGELYINLNGSLVEELLAAELPPQMRSLISIDMDKLWFSMDLEKMMDNEGGMSWAQYLALSRGTETAGAAELVRSALGQVSLTSSQTGYTDLKAVVEKVAEALSDSGLVKEGNTCTVNLLDTEYGDTAARMKLVLTMARDQVTAYGVELQVSSRPQGEFASETSVTVSAYLDERNDLKGKLALNMGPMLTGELDISGGYRQGTAAPQTKPPAGAVVLDMGGTKGTGSL